MFIKALISTLGFHIQICNKWWIEIGNVFFETLTVHNTFN